jgi:hypothetical protein
MTLELSQPFLVVDLIGRFGHIHRLRIKLLTHCGKSNTFASQSSQPSSPRAGFARDFRSISALDAPEDGG